MNKKATNILEYNKIVDMLIEQATCDPGRELCAALWPETDITVIRRLQAETTDMLGRIERQGTFAMRGLQNIIPSIKSMEIGSTLGIRELLDISCVLHLTETAARYATGPEDPVTTANRELHVDTVRTYQNGQTNTETETYVTGDLTGCLDLYFTALTPLPDVMREIDRCIISEDEISDDASPELKSLRRQIRNANDRIKSELNSIVGGSNRAYLQDAVITSREGRYCIPVKAEYKSQIPGMIHDQSKGGSTFFIEPMSVVKLNNEIRELQIKETEEIARILARLSVMAGNYPTELTTNYEMLVKLDFIMAKAKLSRVLHASEPIMNTEGNIDIKKGRHPLIDAHKVVPVDIIIGDSYHQLIVTGPNTGGKTVTLKTIGLFSLMGQSGLHIPAAENSKLTVFKNIFADIGDEQSIEQSLSTFSSHMRNIVNILKMADERCLVLFDELCAGTDPTEGAALAIAILTHLHRLGVTTVATTHYSELKIYALSTEGVENACCEFDVATLSPTYRLLIGIPGKSNAFAISGKLGLPSDLISEAKASIGQNDQAFEDVIADLNQSRMAIEKEQREIEALRAESEALKKALSEEQEALAAKREQYLAKAREEAAALLQDAKDTADETIRVMNKAAVKGMSMADLEASRKALNDKKAKIDAKRTIKAEKKPQKEHSAEEFHIGDAVHVCSMNMDGTVHTLPDKAGFLQVTLGIMHTKVHIRDLIILQEATAEKQLANKSSGLGRMKMAKTASISTEVNLIGMTADEAIMALDKYLDDAYLSHLPSVRVVHGKGSGILRNAVHNYLKRQKHVKSYHLGEYGEGDAGVTIVEFK